jgi:hypothetical protein
MNTPDKKPNLVKQAFTSWPHCLATYFAIGMLIAIVIFCR